MELKPHQIKASRRLFKRQGGVVWGRVGSGKTRICYKHFAMVAKQVEQKFDGKVLPRFLVVCRREGFYDWTEERTKCGLPFRVREVETEDDIYGIKTTKAVVYVVSHGKLARLLPHFLECSSSIFAVCFDEGFLYKNPTTKHCIAANRISAAIGCASILSGSIMTARDLTDVYGQLYAINKHERLARTLTEFRSRFLFKFQIHPNGESKAARFVAARGAGRKVTDRIADIATYYFPSHSARKVVHTVRRIAASREQTRAFGELRNFYDLEYKGHYLELKNKPSVIIKCQQISDGWVKMGDSRLSVSSTKMEYLLAQVAELVSCAEKVVVWCAFQYTVTRILQSLQKHMPSVKAYGMSGGHKFDLAGWLRNGQVAVATVGSGSTFNHFRGCAYAIYYSLDVRWLHLQQSRGRSDRDDSPHKTCYYYYLQTEGSLDHLVYQIATGSGREEQRLIEQGVTAWLTNRESIQVTK